MAIKMIKKDLDIEKIIEFTELSKSDILSIKNEMENEKIKEHFYKNKIF